MPFCPSIAGFGEQQDHLFLILYFHNLRLFKGVSERKVILALNEIFLYGELI